MLELEEIIKVLVSLVLASLIGVEREMRKKPAGLRTHILIAVTATLYTIVSIKYFPQDNARIISNILTGMGFIGAGTIISSKIKVVGITTASTLWFIASIGVLVGVGYYLLALFSALIVLIILIALRDIEKNMIGSKPKK
ncbi:MAG: MgtC/SapB family protein [Candidatus Aenigmatarchaeota archaeon]